MPKAEVGSTKYLNNKLKSKGLQRLRWYCQVCEKQCRDENGMKMHSQSESHVRRMLVVGEDPKKVINEYSNQFIKDFLQLLKTGHGSKQVQMNHFYQEYIANKEHVHMNATKWPSLTEFAKHLGKEGICRVEENEKGIHIAWIDNSPEALRRQEALRKKEAQDQGDEELEQRMIREQIKRAQANAEGSGKGAASAGDDEERELKRQEGEKITLSFGAKHRPEPSTTIGSPAPGQQPSGPGLFTDQANTSDEPHGSAKPIGFSGISLKAGGKPQPKNVFTQAKKNALSLGSSKKQGLEQPKKVSEAERIMNEEMDRKRRRATSGMAQQTFSQYPPSKKSKQ